MVATLLLAAAAVVLSILSTSRGLPPDQVVFRPDPVRDLPLETPAGSDSPAQRDLVAGPTTSQGKVDVNLIGLVGTPAITVSCYLSGRRIKPLWRKEVQADRVLESVPSDQSVDIVVAHSVHAPSRTLACSVGAGQVKRIDFNYSDCATCTIRVVGLPVEWLANKEVTISTIHQQPGRAMSLDASAFLDAGASLTTLCDAGSIGRVRLTGQLYPLVDAHDGKEVVRLQGTLVMKPKEDLAMVAGEIRGRRAAPLFAQVGDRVVSAFDGVIVVPTSSFPGRLTVYDGSANYGWWNEKVHTPNTLQVVALGAPDLSLQVDVDGHVGDQFMLSLFGPERSERPSSSWDKRDPRHRTQRVAAGGASFGGLAPGYYSLRWQAEDSRSPPVARIILDDRPTSVRIAAPRKSVQSYRFPGVVRLAEHLGCKPGSLRMRIKEALHKEVSPGEYLASHWNEDGAVPELLFIDHPLALSGVPVICTDTPDNRRQLNLSPDASLVTFRPQATSGTRINAGRVGDIRLIGQGAYGEFRAVGDRRSPLLTQVWEVGSTGGRGVFHGIFDILEDPNPTVVGKYVELHVVGARSTMRLMAVSRGVATDIGSVDYGRPISHSVWVTDAIQALQVEYNKAVVGAVNDPYRRDVVTISVK